MSKTIHVFQKSCPFGGATAFIRDDDNTAGIAVCSWRDQYNKKRGASIACDRAWGLNNKLDNVLTIKVPIVRSEAMRDDILMAINQCISAAAKRMAKKMAKKER